MDIWALAYYGLHFLQREQNLFSTVTEDMILDLGQVHCAHSGVIHEHDITRHDACGAARVGRCDAQIRTEQYDEAVLSYGGRRYVSDPARLQPDSSRL